MLMYAIYVKCITTTPKDMELVDGLRVMNDGKSYNKKAYAVYTAKMSVSIDPNQGNKQYHSL